MADLPILDTIGGVLAVVFTLLVLFYALGDNPFTRLALHIFIGAAAGYTCAIAIKDVLLPNLLAMFQSGAMIELGIVMAFIVLLLTKISPRLAPLGNPSTALLVGVGAATAVGGAVLGTIFPLATNVGTSSVQQDFFGNFLSAGIIVVGTVTTLIYFHFGAKSIPNQIPTRNQVIEWIGMLGKVFIVTSFSVVFAGVLSASILALVDRLYFIWDFISQLLVAG
ncbi:MAG: hypothetical protein JXB38_09925 [Anaerolineales bacterium]|nr:hypothetical protein [Anaerolineales bacterium]